MALPHGAPGAAATAGSAHCAIIADAGGVGLRAATAVSGPGCRNKASTNAAAFIAASAATALRVWQPGPASLSTAPGNIFLKNERCHEQSSGHLQMRTSGLELQTAEVPRSKSEVLKCGTSALHQTTTYTPQLGHMNGVRPKLKGSLCRLLCKNFSS